MKSFLLRNDFSSRLFRGREAAERKDGAASGRRRSLRLPASGGLPLRLKIISNFLIQREDSVRNEGGAGRARTRGQRFIRRPQGKFDSEKGLKSIKENAQKFSLSSKERHELALVKEQKTKTAMIKYLAYCRKSTDEKEKQVLSIDQQIAELKEFAQRENLEISEFLTEAQSAKIPGRPVFNDLVKRVEKGEISGIVSWNPDRLARNSVDGGKIIYLLDLGKLESLKFPTHWFENTPQGRFMLSIAFGQAKYYVDNLSQNVQRGLRFKIKRGIWPARCLV